MPQLKILTQNCYAFPRCETRFLKLFGRDLMSRVSLPTTIRLKCLANLIKLHDPDIILLQEVWHRHNKDLMTAHFPHYFSTHGPSRGCCCNLGMDSGLLILSKYPIDRHACHTFRHKGHGDGLLARKGVLMAQIRVSFGQSFTVFNTHWDGATRDQQVMEVQEALQEFSDAKSPVIGGGDLNTSSIYDPKISSWNTVLLDTTLRNTNLQFNAQVCPASQGTDFHENSLIDYIVSNAKILVQQLWIDRTAITSGYSDHGLVVGSFKV